MSGHDDFRREIINQTLNGRPSDALREEKSHKAESSQVPPSDTVKTTDGSQGDSLGGLLESTLEARAEKDAAALREQREAREEIIEQTDPSMVHGIMDKLFKR